MKLYYLVAVTVDEAQIVDDNPPEDITQAIADEIRSNLDSCEDALGIIHVEVYDDAAMVIRDLRKSLAYYAKADVGWAEAVHADAYEASRFLVADDDDERCGLDTIADPTPAARRKLGRMKS